MAKTFRKRTPDQTRDYLLHCGMTRRELNPAYPSKRRQKKAEKKYRARQKPAGWFERKVHNDEARAEWEWADRQMGDF